MRYFGAVESDGPKSGREGLPGFGLSLSRELAENMDNLSNIPLWVYLLGAISGLILLEFSVLFFREKRDNQKRLNGYETLSSLGIGLVYFMATKGAMVLFWYGVQIYLYENFRFFTLDATVLWVWLALLIGEDFTYYWVHRLEHEVRLFWCTHMTHHTPEHMNFSTAVRMPPGEALYHPIFRLWLPLLGFHPLMYPALGAFNLVMGLLQHTELVDRLGPLEEVLATPSHHRVHHGSNPEYIDKNYGARLIIWDRLFGTFQREIVPPVYGLTTSLNTQNPVKLLFAGYAALGRDMVNAPDPLAAAGEAFRRPSGANPAGKASLN